MAGISLVVGGDSMIGAALAQALRRDGCPVLATTRRTDGESADGPFLDLSDPDPRPPVVDAAMATGSVAYLCAAVARLQDCRRDPAGAAAVNVRGMVTVARRLLEQGVALLYLSTNQVLDGRTPWPSADAPRAPATVYGCQKAEAEAAILELSGNGPPVAALRLTKVVHPGMPLFDGWIASLKAGKPITPFADMAVAPVHVRTVVTAARAIGEGGGNGIFQLSASADVTYADLARHIARRIGCDEGLVRPVSWMSMGPSFEPPAPCTALDCSRLMDVFGVAAPGPLDGVDLILSGHSNLAHRGA